SREKTRSNASATHMAAQRLGGAAKRWARRGSRRYRGLTCPVNRLFALYFHPFRPLADVRLGADFLAVFLVRFGVALAAARTGARAARLGPGVALPAPLPDLSRTAAMEADTASMLAMPSISISLPSPLYLGSRGAVWAL